MNTIFTKGDLQIKKNSSHLTQRVKSAQFSEKLIFKSNLTANQQDTYSEEKIEENFTGYAN